MEHRVSDAAAPMPSSAGVTRASHIGKGRARRSAGRDAGMCAEDHKAGRGSGWPRIQVPGELLAESRIAERCRAVPSDAPDSDVGHELMSFSVHLRVPGGALAKAKEAVRRSRGRVPGSVPGSDVGPVRVGQVELRCVCSGSSPSACTRSKTGPAERLLPGCSGREQVRGRGLPCVVLVSRGLILDLRSCDPDCWVGHDVRLNGAAHEQSAVACLLITAKPWMSIEE
ncbi:uncharacterized protein LOC142775669 isoform X2 [Rhipicephalus microplus]|uniref:uncharacterized protein LOC142775669 isoform X2 n=1 Tax=Rhipicephalus microplus TaxID=6941 RepID=UPI003F6BDE26